MRYRCGSAVAPRSSLCPSYNEQGTRSFSDVHLWRQPVLFRASRCASSAERYFRPLFCGDHLRFFAMWTYVGFSALFISPQGFGA